MMFHTLKTCFGKHSQKKSVTESFKTFITEAKTIKQSESIFAEKGKEVEHVPAYTKKSGSHRYYETPDDIHPSFGKAKLTADQLDGIYEYVGSGSSSINHDLHEHHRKPKNASFTDTFHYHRKIDSAFADKKNWVGKNHVVYTGVPESPERIFKKDAEKNPDHNPEHVHVHLPAYTSTSTDFNTAKDFTSGDYKMDDQKRKIAGHVLKINVPKNHPSMSVLAHSPHKSEQEVLLHRGTQLKIHSKPEIHTSSNWDGSKRKHYVWNADVVGHNPDQLPGKTPTTIAGK